MFPSEQSLEHVKFDENHEISIKLVIYAPVSDMNTMQEYQSLKDVLASSKRSGNIVAYVK